MDDRIGAPPAVVLGFGQPSVEAQIVVRRWDVRGVVRRDRVGAEPARRLDRDEDVAEVEPREVEGAVAYVDLAGWLTPQLGDLGAGVAGERVEPEGVGVGGERADGDGDLLVAEGRS